MGWRPKRSVLLIMQSIRTDGIGNTHTLCMYMYVRIMPLHAVLRTCMILLYSVCSHHVHWARTGREPSLPPRFTWHCARACAGVRTFSTIQVYIVYATLSAHAEWRGLPVSHSHLHITTCCTFSVSRECTNLA